MRPEEDWSEVWERFQRARDLPKAEQLQSLAGASASVREEVEALLAEDGSAELEGPQPGKRYGKYVLIARLGAGGMGEVFSARDEELGRLVAIKFVGARRRMLPEAMQQLAREAKAASALNHPNLVTVHEVLRFDDGLALVTELVEGRPLRAVRGESRPVAEVANWGSQIARALGAAHAGSIVHRDIKPQNVMLRPDGLIKVLDFGSARWAGTEEDEGPLTLGTLGYMSPEQTRGEPLSFATDVFSLGVMLYELTGGEHPFREDTAKATTQAIHRREVSVPVPAARGGRRFSRLLRAMLEKNPARRPPAQHVAAELETIARPGAMQRLRSWWPLAVAVSAAAMAAVWFGWPGFDSRQPAQFTEPASVTNYSGIERQPSVSPDGKWLLFVWSGPEGGQDDVYLRSMRSGDETPIRITNDPQDEFTPIWSPDGRRIAWERRAMDGRNSALMVAGFDGTSVGPARQVGAVADHEGFFGLAWWPDSGSLVMRDEGPAGNPLVQVAIEGGHKVVLTTPRNADDSRPVLSPDGRRFAFVRSAQGATSICTVPARTSATDQCRAIPFSVNGLAWAADARSLFYSADQALWQVDARDVAQPIRLRDGDFSGLAAAGNVFVFSRIVTDANIWSLDVATGRSVQFIASSAEESEPQFSPDGHRILFRSNRSGSYQVYICARDGSGVHQLTELQGHVGSARWSPDGRWVAFDSGRSLKAGSWTAHDNIYVVPAEGGAPRRLTDDRDDSIVPGWSADSRTVYFTRGVAREAWRVAMDGGAAERVSEHEMWDIQESRDGKWLWFEQPSTTPGIWRRAMGNGRGDGRDVRVAGTEQAVYRTWDIAGDGLFFLRRGPEPGFVRLVGGQAKIVGPAPKRLLRGPRTMAVSPDGKTILYTEMDVAVGDVYRIERRGSS